MQHILTNNDADILSNMYVTLSIGHHVSQLKTISTETQFENKMETAVLLFYVFTTIFRSLLICNYRSSSDINFNLSHLYSFSATSDHAFTCWLMRRSIMDSKWRLLLHHHCKHRTILVSGANIYCVVIFNIFHFSDHYI